MNFAFTDEQREIQETARRLMEETAKLDHVRELSETVDGYDRAEWEHLAELGWTGLHIPEQYGGVGLTYVELMVVLEQMGAALYASPFFSTVCLAANALLEVGPDSQADLLAAIAAGEKTATLAINEGDGWTSDDIELSAVQDGDEWVLSGSKQFVTDGHSVDEILVVARTGGSGSDGVSLFVVGGDSAGLTRTPVRAIDETRKLAQLDFDGVRVPASALVGSAGDAWPGIERALQLASVALAAEMLGGAQHCFDLALAYSKDRIQFGRPIAAFQAVKHKCADLLMAVEQSRSAAYYAGWVAASEPSELAAVSSLAKAQVADSYWMVARGNIQIHGGIGFTYEHEAHLYYRRAQASRTLLGDSDHHRELMLQGLGV